MREYRYTVPQWKEYALCSAVTVAGFLLVCFSSILVVRIIGMASIITSFLGCLSIRKKGAFYLITNEVGVEWGDAKHVLFIKWDTVDEVIHISNPDNEAIFLLTSEGKKLRLDSRYRWLDDDIPKILAKFLLENKEKGSSH